MPQIFLPQLYDRLVRLIAHATRAPIVIILAKPCSEAKVLAVHGIEITARDAKWLCRISKPTTNTLIQYMKHPHKKSAGTNRSGKSALLCDDVPAFIDTIVALPIVAPDNEILASILICDAQQKFPFTSSLSFLLAEASQIVGDSIIHSKKYAGSTTVRTHQSPGLSEPELRTNFESTDKEPTCKFLVDTLVKRRTVKTRNEISFLTTRAWRAPLKAYQINALTALKTNPPESLLKTAASDVTEMVQQLTGTPRYDHVVPMPCGHSKTDRCFSVQLAERVAQSLSLPVLQVFESEPRKGSSHPRKSAHLQPFKWLGEPTGAVLLIDDVVSSGKHIEMAVNQLRNKVAHVTAVAWVGN